MEIVGIALLVWLLMPAMDVLWEIAGRAIVAGLMLVAGIAVLCAIGACIP